MSLSLGYKTVEVTLLLIYQIMTMAVDKTANQVDNALIKQLRTNIGTSSAVDVGSYLEEWSYRWLKLIPLLAVRTLLLNGKD